jgi:protein-S-isoprenylcysteine O-methyltransferase Ste14
MSRHPMLGVANVVMAATPLVAVVFAVLAGFGR